MCNFRTSIYTYAYEDADVTMTMVGLFLGMERKIFTCHTVENVRTHVTVQRIQTTKFHW